jgi:GTP cyclohydrolase IB
MELLMKDAQSARDSRGIAIDQVGITKLCYPISIMNKEGDLVPTVADITMSVSLPQHLRGTHMSRFLEVLVKHRGEITPQSLTEVVRDLKERQNVESACFEVAFPYFIEKTAPVTGARAKVACHGSFVVSSSKTGESLRTRVVVPVKTVCPCSKEISDYGAHNQRGHVTIEVYLKTLRRGWAWIWLEELVEIAEKSASAPVYALLKRPDERHVTMQAYDNPVFVEDLVRNASVLLKRDPRITSFTVQAVNQESIHAHDAFARVTWKRESRSRSKK